MRRSTRSTRSLPALLAALALAAAGCDDPVRSVDPAALEVAAESSALEVGDSLVVAATLRDARGNPLSGRELAWSSSDTLVATVSAGVVRGRSPGRATITAAAGEARGSLDLGVEPRVDSIFLAQDNRTTFVPGASAQLRVAGMIVLVDGVPQRVERAVRWSSSDPAVASVGDSGTVRGVAPGTATLTVTAGKASRQLPVRVVRPYSVTPLETPDGATAVASDVNAAGVAVGTVTRSGSPSQAVLWRGGRMTVLGSGEAHAVNDAEQVAGASGGAAVVWEGGVAREVFRRGTWARATAINRSGDVAGDWSEVCPCRYPDGGAFAILGGDTVDVVPRDPYMSPRVYGINDAGWVVGSLYNNRSAPDAFVYRNGERVNLETSLFGVTGGSSQAYSEAAAVNDRGQVVGYGPSSEGSYAGLQRAFLLEEGRVTWMGPRDPPPSGARDVNDRGEVVGQVGGIARPHSGALTQGFLWSGGVFSRLEWLVEGDRWTFREGIAVNQRGQILARAVDTSTGATVHLLLTPAD